MQGSTPRLPQITACPEGLSESKPQKTLLGELNEKYLDCRRGRQHSWSSCEGESIEPWLSEMLLLPQQRGVPIRKSFQDKKPGRSSGFGREFGSFQNSPALGQSHKPTAFFVATSEKASGASPAASPAPGHSPRGGFLWGQPDQQHRAVSEWEQHPRSFELLYHRLHTHTHTQANTQPTGNSAAPSNPAGCPSACSPQGPLPASHLPPPDTFGAVSFGLASL